MLLNYLIGNMHFVKYRIFHFVKRVQIRGYFWSVFSCIRTEYRKIRNKNNSVFGLFSRSVPGVDILWKLRVSTKFRAILHQEIYQITVFYAVMVDTSNLTLFRNNLTNFVLFKVKNSILMSSISLNQELN